MKTNLLLITALLLAFFNVSAQNDTHFGLKAAMNLAGLSGIELEDGYEKSIRMAFGGGIFLNKELTSQTSIQIEAMYSAQGVELESNNNPDELYRLDYLSVPIMYRYHFEEKGSFSVQFGVHPAMLLNRAEMKWVCLILMNTMREQMPRSIVLMLGSLPVLALVSESFLPLPLPIPMD